MQDRANVAVLPPLIPLAMIGFGFLVHLAFPLALASAGITRPLGALAVLASVAIVVAAARELAKAQTAFDVRKSTTALVDTGVFRWSRNPVYFSMMLLSLGIALLVNSLPMFLLSLPAGSLLCLWVIRPEAGYLERKFWRSVSGLQRESATVGLTRCRRNRLKLLHLRR
jgi:protein-S-isoprenylcysteine O-methyltransferase Ste14